MSIDLNRLKHSVAVARKMIEIGRLYNLDDQKLQELFVLGMNHDIGYEFCKDGVDHNIIGGNILKENGYKYWREVFNHGNPDPDYSSLYLKILNTADMQIDKDGNDVGFDKRLEDIKQRYGENSKTYICSKKIIDNLKILKESSYEE